jgi:hypothetical protein
VRAMTFESSIWRLSEADTCMIETLAMGVPLATRSLATNLAVTVYLGSTMITYPPETIPGSEYLIDCKYQNNLSFQSCFVLRL